MTAEVTDTPLDFALRYAAQPSPECGKRAAIAAYCWRVLPLESCARLFARNPDWRSA